MLPPLNARLAADAIASALADVDAEPTRLLRTIDALVELLTRSFGARLRVAVGHATSCSIRCRRQRARIRRRCPHATRCRSRKLLRGYPHMAIHPYPVELIGDVPLRDGTVLHVRPIRPEDADIERAFVNGLSEQTRYYRFFYRLARAHACDARALHAGRLRPRARARGDRSSRRRFGQAFVGVARYIANPGSDQRGVRRRRRPTHGSGAASRAC